MFLLGFPVTIGKGIAKGLDAVPVSGLDVQIQPGVGFNDDGLPVYVDTATTVSVASPAGNPAKTLIVLRPTETATTPIPEPVNPINTVDLHVQFTHEVVVLDGTPAASPVYPTPNAEDIVLMGIELGAGQASIALADFDLSQRDVLNQLIKKVRPIVANYTAVVGDEIIEADATAGALNVTLPDVNLFSGRKLTVVKVDNAANDVGIVTPGSETINGAADWDLTAQWEKVTLYSNGVAWRIV